jgi:GNAT superfamily N-acetyltransferase
VRRQLPGGYELDDDRDRLDLDIVHGYLGGEAYWAKGRTREQMAAAIAGSRRVVGLYLGADQVGFARVVSDGIAFAYLADVFVLEAHRGKGLGVELVREAVDGDPGAPAMRWILATRDAHDLYRRFGFGVPTERVMERPPPHDRG